MSKDVQPATAAVSASVREELCNSYLNLLREHEEILAKMDKLYYSLNESEIKWVYTRMAEAREREEKERIKRHEEILKNYEEVRGWYLKEGYSLYNQTLYGAPMETEKLDSAKDKCRELYESLMKGEPEEQIASESEKRDESGKERRRRFFMSGS